MPTETRAFAEWRRAMERRLTAVPPVFGPRVGELLERVHDATPSLVSDLEDDLRLLERACEVRALERETRRSER